MALELISAPAIEPVTFQQVLDHMRINPFDEAIDEASIAYIDTLISAVRADTEDFLNRALITQTWKFLMDAWPEVNYIELPKPPLQSVSAVVVVTDDPIPTVTYFTDTVSKRGKIILTAGTSWPSVTLSPMNPIQIEFICGYGSLAENIPPRIIQAILIGVADLYENRESFVQGQPIHRLDTVERLLYPFKIWDV